MYNHSFKCIISSKLKVIHMCDILSNVTTFDIFTFFRSDGSGRGNLGTL